MPHVHVNGTDIHYHIEGHGPAIVMIHPPFLGSRVFNYLRTDLAQDHRVVSIDVRGHGHSEAGDAALTVPLIVEDIKQVMNRLDVEEGYVLGYSAGCMPAMEAMITHPERFTGGIIISGAGEFRDRRNRGLMRAASISSRLRAKEAVILPVALGNADSRTTFHVLHREAMAGNATRFREYSEACIGYSCMDRLRAIAAPVLLLCGASDPTYVQYARELHEHLAVSELYLVRGAWHQLPTKAPDRTASAIRTWIAKLEVRDNADSFMERDALDHELLEMGVLSERQAAFGNPQDL
ncbi:alpha/beta hydrolase [Paenibacillus darwinianus]|uniref:Alpha/beta hydrolase n=1 Tax=Paenibacillus darwinianus TaxID=1380763 RepID=A0A9W5W7K4_9BACL|nr:alpha/beta hydrolase [Paenibacillus darwinianus]EXX87814.1 alpha/beta hydrolase [Paenibacillus darwinianus]EXX89226.1 alpha/beta hydrolase [Paenibacillus darwinianus]EXX90025.1 alpha/beta hydrolase [Paenibacillus darwinianus]